MKTISGNIVQSAAINPDSAAIVFQAISGLIRIRLAKAYLSLKERTECLYKRLQGLGVMLKDEHPSGASITLIRGSQPGAFIVKMDVAGVFDINIHFASEVGARHDYYQLRSALWGAVENVPFYVHDIPTALLLAIEQMTEFSGSFADQAAA